MFKFPGWVRGTYAALCGLLLITLLSPAASAQKDFQPATAANAKQFVGVWNAIVQDRPFMTITLTTEQDKLVGTMSHADIEVNKEGELTKAEPSGGEDPIANLRVKGNILRITIKTSDGDSIQSGLTLTAADEAELQMLVPSGVPTPKPWKLKRVSTN